MTSADTLKIKCPHCRGILTVRNTPGIETKHVTCPLCRQRSPFVSFQEVENAGRPGYLTMAKTGMVIPLRIGPNVIGRKAHTSAAQWQLPCDDRNMSREHVTVEVAPVAGNGFARKIYLYKETANAVAVNGKPLVYGSPQQLNDGDIIKLPGATLRFTINRPQ